MRIEVITVAIAALPASERRRLYVELERQEAGDPAAPEQEALSAHDLDNNYNIQLQEDFALHLIAIYRA